MNFTKKIFGLIFVITVVFSTSFTAFAATGDYVQVGEINNAMLENYALNFAKEVDCSLDLEIGEIIPIYDVTNRVTGYCIEYWRSEIPYGYINLNFNYDDPVMEFVIQENARSLFVWRRRRIL